MRDPARIPAVLQAIHEIWQAHPDWRLGQLLCNVAAWADPTQDGVWDIEDDVLVAEVKRHLAERGQTGAPTAG